jgi:histidinol-phosphate aminotransferase
MAGMRIGYALCSTPALADALRKTTCVFNVPSLAQHAAKAALEDEAHLLKILEAVAAGRTQLADGFRGLGLAPLASVGNFVSVEVPATGKAVAAAMFERGIQIHAWSDPGYERFIRITVGEPEDNAACVAALGAVLSRVPAAAEPR